MVNAYDILGLTPEARPDEIRTAFRQKAQIHHPDKGGEAAHFHTIQKAYEILSNEKTREFIGRLPQFERLPLRIQPSMSRSTQTLFENLNRLDDQLKEKANRRGGDV